MIPEKKASAGKISAGRRSQAAMEFLLSYGWAILIVLVVIAALVYYGVLDPTMLLPEKCIIQPGPLACTDSKAFFFGSTNGQFHLEFTNILDKTVQIKSIKLARHGFDPCERSVSMTVVPGSKACIPMYCLEIPKRWGKQGFEMEIKYSTGDLEKVLAGDLYVGLEETYPFYVEGCPMLPGDGNGDGIVNNDDVTLMHGWIMSQPPDESVFDYSAYDIDNDTAITGIDVTHMRNVINGCKCCEDQGLMFEIIKMYKEDPSVNVFAECRKSCLPFYGPESACLELGNKDIDGDGDFDIYDTTKLNDIMLKCRCCTRAGDFVKPTNIVEEYQEDPATYDYTAECAAACGAIPPNCPPLQPT